MRNFRQLRIWQESKKLALDIYRLTQALPAEEKFGLCSQMRRCSISVPSNIAEGCSRRTHKNFAYFLDIAIGSAYELETQVSIAQDLGYIELDIAKVTCERIIKLQKGINTLRTLVLKDSNYK